MAVINYINRIGSMCRILVSYVYIKIVISISQGLWEICCDYEFLNDYLYWLSEYQLNKLYQYTTKTITLLVCRLYKAEQTTGILLTFKMLLMHAIPTMVNNS